jgi:hypothetical protein
VVGGWDNGISLENAIIHHGRLDPGVHLLSKPYRRQEMAVKVRKALE